MSFWTRCPRTHPNPDPPRFRAGDDVWCHIARDGLPLKGSVLRKADQPADDPRDGFGCYRVHIYDMHGSGSPHEPGWVLVHESEMETLE